MMNIKQKLKVCKYDSSSNLSGALPLKVKSSKNMNLADFPYFNGIQNTIT